MLVPNLRMHTSLHPVLVHGFKKITCYSFIFNLEDDKVDDVKILITVTLILVIVTLLLVFVAIVYVLRTISK